MRRSAETIPESRRSILLPPPVRTRRRYLLRRGMDAAFQRRADHPRRGDSAVAARQYRAPRRRHPALRGHASIQGSTDIPTLYDILPGYLPMPFFEKDANDLPELHQEAQGERRAVVELRKLHRQPAEVLVRRQRHEGKRLGLRLPAARHRRSFAFRLLARHAGRQDGRLFIMGQNPAVGAPMRACNASAVEAEVAGGPRHGGNRDRFLVVQLAGSEARRTEAGRDRDRGVSLSRRRLGRKRRLPHQHAAAASNSVPKAVDPPGRRAQRGWFMYHLGRRLKAKAAADPSPRNAPLNALHWHYSTHGIHDEPNVNEILKEINGRDLDNGRVAAKLQEAEEATARTASRLLDLLRHLSAGTRQQGQPARVRGLSRPRLGILLAQRHPHSLQPLLGAARRQAVERAQEAGLVGRGQTRVDRLDVPDFDKNKAPDYQPAPGVRRAWTRSPGDKPFILHPDGVGWLFVTSGLKDGPLPTHYEPLETPFGNPLYPEHIYNPAADRKERPDNPYARSGGRALPVRAHHLSPDRASHRRRHVASAIASGGAAAGAVLRSLAGTGRRDRICEHGDWATITTPRAHHRGARAGDHAHAAVVDRRPHRASGRTAVSLGLQRRW